MTEARLVTQEQLRAALDATGRVIVLRTSRLEVNDGIEEVFAALPAAAPAEGLPVMHLEYDGEDEDAYVVTEDQRTVGVIRAALARHESEGSE